MDIRVGGKYKITKKLGSGAFGDIYQGVNLKTNEEVAIKLVNPPFNLILSLLGIPEEQTALALVRSETVQSV